MVGLREMADQLDLREKANRHNQWINFASRKPRSVGELETLSASTKLKTYHTTMYRSTQGGERRRYNISPRSTLNGQKDDDVHHQDCDDCVVAANAKKKKKKKRRETVPLSVKPTLELTKSKTEMNASV